MKHLFYLFIYLFNFYPAYLIQLDHSRRLTIKTAINFKNFTPKTKSENKDRIKEEIVKNLLLGRPAYTSVFLVVS